MGVSRLAFLPVAPLLGVAHGKMDSLAGRVISRDASRNGLEAYCWLAMGWGMGWYG